MRNHTRHDSDLYPTEYPITRILLNSVRHIGGNVCEPCAGPGWMSDILSHDPRINRVLTNDIDSQWDTDFVSDATVPDAKVWTGMNRSYDWVITNPPFNGALDILRNAWDRSNVGVAFLVRLSFLEPTGERSGNRGDWLHAHKDNMTLLEIFSQPRPSFTGDGKTDNVSVAWMVWEKNFSWSKLGIVSPFQFAMRWKNE